MVQFNEFDVLDHFIEKDTFINMKCRSCGYEEKMPSWCFDEVASSMKAAKNFDTPHIYCPRCDKETLYPKDKKK